MFYGCSSLISIDLSSFNTSKVEEMNELFFGCSSLTSLNLSNFNAQRILSMNYMFYGCSKLIYIDISYFAFPSDLNPILFDKNIPSEGIIIVKDGNAQDKIESQIQNWKIIVKS